jgi:hypothetical protein
MNLIVRICFVFILLSFVTKASGSIASINLAGPNEKIDIYREVEMLLEDGDSSFDWQRLKKANFKKPEKLWFYGAVKGKTLWMRFKLKNTSIEDFIYFFTLKNGYLGSGQVFLAGTDGIQKLYHHSYSTLKKKDRIIHYPTWKIQIPKQDSLEVYVKITDNAKRTRIRCSLKGEQDFYSYGFSVFASLAGFFFLFIVYIFFLIYLTVFTKQFYVLFYAVYLLSFSVDFLAYHGIGQSFIWIEHVFWVHNIRSMSHALSIASISFFLYKFYKMHDAPKWVLIFFLASGILFLVFLSLYGFKYSLGGMINLYRYVWRAIKYYSIILVFIHVLLALKRIVPFYLPLVFILHILCSYAYANFIFPYTKSAVLNWLIYEMYFISLSFELAVWSYYIVRKIKSIKQINDTLQVNIEKLQSKIASLKFRIEKQKTETIRLKSKALVVIKDIQYIKSDGAYLDLFLSGQSRPEVDRNSLKNILEELPSQYFLQIHRSVIVNIIAIKSIYFDRLILKNGVELSISRKYKSIVFDSFKGNMA